MLRSLRLVPGHLPDSASLLQPSFAQQRKKPLLPAVSIHASSELLDKFAFKETFIYYLNWARMLTAYTNLQ